MAKKNTTNPETPKIEETPVADTGTEVETSEETPKIEETPVADTGTEVETSEETPKIEETHENEVKPISNREAARLLRAKHEGN